MKRLILLLLVAGLVFPTGCASVLKGTSQTLTFTSEPEGAQVFIDGKEFGETPLSVKLPKNKFSNVLFKKEGYQSRQAVIEKRFDGLMIMSIIFWDLGTTDLLTGAIFEYSPDSYFVELEKEAGA